MKQRGSLKARTVVSFIHHQIEGSGEQGKARFGPVCQLKATKRTRSVCWREVYLTLSRPSLPWISRRVELNSSWCFLFFFLILRLQLHDLVGKIKPSAVRFKHLTLRKIMTFGNKQHPFAQIKRWSRAESPIRRVAYLRKPLPSGIDDCYQLSECHCVS